MKVPLDPPPATAPVPATAMPPDKGFDEQSNAAKHFRVEMGSLPPLWSGRLADEDKPGTVLPVPGGPPVTDGRVWQPEDKDHPTSPFVIGKLARDGVKAFGRVGSGLRHR
jgi:hypothetical protein